MRRIHTRHVTVRVPDELMEWPGHREEIDGKVDELEELISSITTGQIERWR